MVELRLDGDVEGVIDEGDDGLEFMRPQTIEVPGPGTGDHVAVIRTDTRVALLSLYSRDDPDAFDSDLGTLGYLDGDGCHEFWIDASVLADADIMHVDSECGDLESVDPHVEYRGVVARPQKSIRGLKQKRRVRKAIRRDPEY